MKFLPLASLALVISLSGCSNAPDQQEDSKVVENQVKLIEYEICLERLFKEYDLRKEYLDKEIPLEAFFKECSKYLPLPRP